MITSKSVVVSKIFGVSPKAVRDIWNQRTWRHSTSPLFPVTELTHRAKYWNAIVDMASQEMTAKRKVVGRPRGSKDSKPRRMRCHHRYDVMSYETNVSSHEHYLQHTHVPDHRSDRKFTGVQQIELLSSCPVPTSIYQTVSEAEFDTASCFSTMIDGPSVSNVRCDYGLPGHDFGIEEGEALRRSYPFFLQF